MSTTPAPQASLAAPMLVLLGPVVTMFASFVASAGQPLQLVEEAGALAFVAVGASFVVTPCVAALLFVGSRGGSRWPALAAPLTLVPWAFMALAVVLGAGLVADAVSHADPASQLGMMGMGASEVMASRMLGAALVLGAALALSAAMLALALAPRAEGAEPRVPGSGVTALVLLGVAAVALAVLMDATVLRRGLAAASQADAATRAAVLSQTLLEARGTHVALLAVLAGATFLGFGAALVAMPRGRSGGALVVGTAWLAGAVFGGADIVMVHYVAATLAIPVPWEGEADFVPLALEGAGVTSVALVDCVATLARVRCFDADSDYDTLDRALQPPPATSMAVDGMPGTAASFAGVRLAGDPALTVAIDARLPALRLRQLLVAAVHLGYRSLTVVGAAESPGFREGDVPPLLRHQALVTPRTSWLLSLAVRDGGDDLAPVAIEVGDDDTAETVARRASAVVDQSVLVLPAPLPRVAPPAPPSDADGIGLLGSPAPQPTPSTLDASSISRIMRANVASVRACYERGLQADPNLAGRTVVHFTITPSGAVEDVTASPTLAAPAVLRCMEAAVASLTFPADEAREPISINYPFVFNAGP